MNPRFIDTNIFLEAYLREGERSAKCLKLLESEAKLATSWLVVGELEWVLRSVYKLERGDIARIISSVLSIPGLEIPDKRLIVKALKIYDVLSIDWTDCLNAVIAVNSGATGVYSYDRDFDKLSPEGLTRLEP